MTREDILDAAAQVIRKKGFHAASMASLIASPGFSVNLTWNGPKWVRKSLANRGQVVPVVPEAEEGLVMTSGRVTLISLI